jgi:hypothetical protein
MMAQTTITPEVLKQVMKEALIETLNEQRDLFRNVMTEALEDFALIEAIKEGEKTKNVSRERIFDVLEGR